MDQQSLYRWDRGWWLVGGAAIGGPRPARSKFTGSASSPPTLSSLLLVTIPSDLSFQSHPSNISISECPVNCEVRLAVVRCDGFVSALSRLVVSRVRAGGGSFPLICAA